MSAEDDIRKTIAQFANSFDLKDWALLESALAGLITVDYSDLRGDLPKEIIGRGYVQARREALEKLDTQHIIGNLGITVDGERASVRASSMILQGFERRCLQHPRHAPVRPAARSRRGPRPEVGDRRDQADGALGRGGPGHPQRSQERTAVAVRGPLFAGL